MATNEQIQALINEVAPYCQEFSKKYGYKVCSPAIAQTLQESLGKYEGLSYLAYKYNNLHGIKTYPKWTGETVKLKTKEEYVKGVLTPVYSDFCIFKNKRDGVENYYLFLERNPRYRNVKLCTTPLSYLETIKADKYCTSSDYVNNCYQKILKYNLTRFDDGYVAQQGSSTSDMYIPGNTYTLLTNLYIRQNPNGTKLKMDALTIDAKKHAHYDDIGNAILDKGTRVTCRSVIALDDQIWMEIPSGYVCAHNGIRRYIE